MKSPSYRFVGRVVSTLGTALTMEYAGEAENAQPGEVLKFSYVDVRQTHVAPPMRHGEVRVVFMDAASGVIHVDNAPRSWVVAMCDGDFAYVEETAHDDANREHAALIEHLLCAVHRGDWHATSDAACDLRVLEARRGRP